MNNAILRFAKQLTQYDPLLQARVEGLYHKIFEGTGTLAALNNLKDRVGDNSFETEGDGVFGLSNEAGFDDAQVPNADLDQAIDDGVEAGNYDDFGTAISAETAPSEDDFGLGDEGPMDGGDDLFGEDTGTSGDLGLDGMDDEIPEDGGEGGDDVFGDAGIDEQANEDGKDGGDLGGMPDGDFDLGV